MRIVLLRRAELLSIADRLGARGLALCGSVVRGEDHAGSDIDFYVCAFDISEDARTRARRLVAEIRELLDPYRVDVRGIPGWLLGAEHERQMRRDAVELKDLPIPSH